MKDHNGSTDFLQHLTICFTILDVFLGPMHYSPSFSVHSHRLLAFPDWNKTSAFGGRLESFLFSNSLGYRICGRFF